MIRMKNGFTVVELLVVVSIIALLMAITIPVVGNARAKGRISACQSNLRQIGMAYADMVSSQSSGLLPKRDAAENYGQTAKQLMKYVGNSANIFICPANPGDLDVGGATMTFPNDPARVTHYAFNEYLARVGNEIRHENGIESFSEAAVAYDFPYDPTTERAHSDGINIGYYDGHAAFVPDNELGLAGEETPFFEKGHEFAEE